VEAYGWRVKKIVNICPHLKVPVKITGVLSARGPWPWAVGGPALVAWSRDDKMLYVVCTYVVAPLISLVFYERYHLPTTNKKYI
jgi:hypothetical protein